MLLAQKEWPRRRRRRRYDCWVTRRRRAPSR